MITNPKILVGICSCRAYAEKRKAVRETWLSRSAAGIECCFFVGGGKPIVDESDTVVLDCDDSYEYLPQKVLAFFKHALETSDFEWLFKCDDDTYVMLDRLRSLAQEEYGIVGDEHIARRGSPSGGSGYLLSRQVVEKIAGDPSLPSRGAEDIIIGEAAIHFGAKPMISKQLHWDAIPYPRASNDMIT